MRFYKAASAQAQHMSESFSEKPRLTIMGYGGTIMSRPEMDEKTSTPVLRPSSGAFDILRLATPDALRDECASINFEARTLIDSSQARANVHIQQIVADVREYLADDTKDALVLLHGTDTMADLMAALGNGVSKKELGDKTVIVTGSMRQVESTNPPTDAIPNYLKAVKLATMDESRGKMGLLFGERFFPPRGIEKIRNGPDAPFQCRFHRIAKYYREDKQWVFREQQPVDIPQGKTGEPYKLTLGVETYGLTATSDYNLLAGAIRYNKATVLLAPGDGNLRTDKDSLKALINATKKARGPIVVIPDALQDAEDQLTPDEDWHDAVYCGRNYSKAHKLIPGGAMTKTEARILLAHLIAKIESKKLSKSDYFDYIATEIALYPFRDAHG